ncbi:MAG: serine/threonine-protein phosphatase [Bacteroidales bacterium]|nr:serine/threonine-protein phosphatase [Bacteroidales bacterium]
MTGMKYKLKVYSIYELGQRSNQEDNMFPKYQQATDDDRLFIVCDGMGGHAAGEVASSLVCEAMSNSIMAACPDAEGAFSDSLLKDALEDAYDALDQNDNGDVKKMGTTMTFLKFHDQGATIAHIGDSRVYHIRPAADKENTRILFQTSDHSLVNDLVKIGELTPEEAKVSKQKNVITRAMQPSLERRPSADIHHVDDVQPGDCFFMCTDGILENMEDENICFIFSDKAGDDANKVNIIIRATEDNKDNHSAYFIRVEDVIGAPVSAPETEPVVENDSPADEPVTVIGHAVPSDPTEIMADDHVVKKSRRINTALIIAAVLVFGVLLFIMIYGKMKPEKKGSAEKAQVEIRDEVKHSWETVKDICSEKLEELAEDGPEDGPAEDDQAGEPGEK